MTRISTALAKARAEGRAALITYLCAGDPDLDATVALLLGAQESGADIVELGMPFSDPCADGPTIEAASVRALAAGATFDGVLGALRAARTQGFDLPVVLFGYYNPILRRGEAQAVADAKAAGVDAFLVVDLPPEEAGPLVGHLREAGMAFVPLVAPTSDQRRAQLAAALADDFLYYVSMTGVTGAAQNHLDSAARAAGELERSLGRSVALGFGVKTQDDAAVVAEHVSGVVVGSAIVQRHAEEGIEGAKDLIRALSQGMARS